MATIGTYYAVFYESKLKPQMLQRGLFEFRREAEQDLRNLIQDLGVSPYEASNYKVRKIDVVENLN